VTNLIEICIILFIIVSLGYPVRKGGAANPVGTGKLRDEVHQVALRLRSVEIELGDVQEHMKTSATTADIKAVEERIAGHHQLALRTAASVDRIEKILIEKAFK